MLDLSKCGFADAVRSHRTLDEVVHWGLMQSPSQLVREVIRQDEYTLDVVLPIGCPGGAGADDGLYLVYDTT